MILTEIHLKVRALFLGSPIMTFVISPWKYFSTIKMLLHFIDGLVFEVFRQIFLSFFNRVCGLFLLEKLNTAIDSV